MMKVKLVKDKVRSSFTWAKKKNWASDQKGEPMQSRCSTPAKIFYEKMIK